MPMPSNEVRHNLLPHELMGRYVARYSAVFVFYTRKTYSRIGTPTGGRDLNSELPSYIATELRSTIGERRSSLVAHRCRTPIMLILLIIKRYAHSAGPGQGLWGHGGRLPQVPVHGSKTKHKRGRIPSHRASQKLSTGCFGGKFNFLSPICDSTAFYNGIQKRPNTEPQGVPEALDRMFR